jgi:DNA-binding CsgD family transcriptional regulator
MDQATNDGCSHSERIDQIVSALENGLVVADRNGRIVWLDQHARSRINGDLQHLELSQPPADGIPCVISSVELPSRDREKVCVLREADTEAETGHNLIAAVEAILSDSSWFTRTFVDKIKAWRQASRPAANSSDLAILTHREREILALICQGKSDAEMSKALNLSQNTVRNHVASLYRKIGVNRRSAAIIWARERALTSTEFSAQTGNGRHRH